MTNASSDALHFCDPANTNGIFVKFSAVRPQVLMCKSILALKLTTFSLWSSSAITFVLLQQHLNDEVHWNCNHLLDSFIT